MSFASFGSSFQQVSLPQKPTKPASVITAAFGALTTLGQIPLTGITYNDKTAYYNVLVNGATVASNQTAATYTYTGLSNNTQYGPFTVVPYNSAGVAGSPFTVSGTQGGTSGRLYTLGVVTSTVTFGSTVATGTTLSCSGTYSSVVITYSPSGGSPASGATVAGVNTTSQAYTGLTENTLYTFSVYAVNGESNGGVQNTVTAPVTGTVTPSPPPLCTAAAFGTLTTVGQIPLTGITYNAYTGYYNVLVNGVTVASNQTAATYTYTGLADNTQYGPFTVVPYNAAGVAGTAFTVTGGTSGSLYTLGVVTSTVTFGSTTSSGTTLSCSGAYSSVIITYSPSGGTPASGAPVSGANTTSQAYTGLTANTLYTFSVYAVNGESNGGVQNTVTAPVTGTITTVSPPLWVAVGNGTSPPLNTIAYSADGTTWTGRGTSIFSDNGYGVAYGNGLWVAVGYGAGTTNTIATSSDGINWTGRGAAISGGGQGVAYGKDPSSNPLWVAVGWGTNSIAYSTDGNTWTGRTGTSIFNGGGQGVAYGKDPNGNGLWVAAGSGTNALAYSADGITWTGRTAKTIFTTNGTGVAYGKDPNANGLWVATGQGGNSIATSSDGINWTARGRTIITRYGLGVAYGKDPNGNGLWVAVGQGTTNALAYSTDGINWTGKGLLYTGGGYGVAYSSSQKLWVAAGDGTNTFAFRTSPDGFTWTGSGLNVFVAGGGVAVNS